MKAVPAKIGILSAIAVSLVLAGCGQKGNLYLPNQKKKVPSTQTPPAQTPPAPDEASGAK
jgi:predicted small lipoprotein YifL